MHTCLRLLGAAAALALGACSTLPIYQPTPADTTVNFVGIPGNTSFCTPDGTFKLSVDEANGLRSAKIPTGKPMTLWTYMSFQGYNVISSCHPALSFTPAPGTNYIINAGLSSGKCFIEAVREDKSRQTGVAPEPTLGGPTC